MGYSGSFVRELYVQISYRFPMMASSWRRGRGKHRGECLLLRSGEKTRRHDQETPAISIEFFPFLHSDLRKNLS